VACALVQTVVDPHVNCLAPNIAVWRHGFEPLVALDASEHPVPGLAESWRLVGEHEWEFKLPQGVTHGDGSPFTVADVIFSLERVRTLPNNVPPERMDWFTDREGKPLPGNPFREGGSGGRTSSGQASSSSPCPARRGWRRSAGCRTSPRNG
jgi:ABC-type transport system substrate-binding protein